MILDDYITLLESPETVDADSIKDLQALLSYAPYCASARMLLLKAMHKAHDTAFAASLPVTTLYARNPRELYFLLYPKPLIRHATVAGNDYFSLVERLEKLSQTTGESFEELARRFKQARLGLLQQEQQTPAKKTEIKPEVATKSDITDEELSEANVRQCISQRQYAKAIELLRELNLRNPKKSSYFAVQIEFLEKALDLQSHPQTSKHNETN